jgi:hypothetical protein
LTAFDEVPNDSDFSNIASTTTPDETPPDAPTDLRVFNATTNSLTLSWEISRHSDAVGFLINRSLNSSGPYEPVNIEPIAENQYVDTGLKEETTYYYKVRAIDEVNLESPYSDFAYGSTLLGQKRPVVNNSIEDFEIPEDSYDDSTINLRNCFIDINDDELTFRCEGQKHIEVTIYHKNGSVILKPEPNWNGLEILTFYAHDGTFEIPEAVTITVTPVNDPPEKPTIIKPEAGTVINEGELLDFSGTSSDLDQEYGDILTFKWSSTIDGNLGTGANMSGVVLSPGNHTIILIVTDDAGARGMSKVDIVVNAKPAKEKSDDGLFSNILMWIIMVVVLIIVLVIIVLVFQKRKKTKPRAWEELVDQEVIEGKEGDVEGMKTAEKTAGKIPAAPAKTKAQALPDHVESLQKELCSSCGLEMVYDEDIESFQCRYCDVFEEE